MKNILIIRSGGCCKPNIYSHGWRHVDVYSGVKTIFFVLVKFDEYVN